MLSARSAGRPVHSGHAPAAEPEDRRARSGRAESTIFHWQTPFLLRKFLETTESRVLSETAFVNKAVGSVDASLVGLPRRCGGSFRVDCGGHRVPQSPPPRQVRCASMQNAITRVDPHHMTPAAIAVRDAWPAAISGVLRVENRSSPDRLPRFSSRSNANAEHVPRRPVVLEVFSPDCLRSLLPFRGTIRACPQHLKHLLPPGIFFNLLKALGDVAMHRGIQRQLAMQ